MSTFIHLELLFPYALPPVLTILACLFLISLILKAKNDSRENKLLKTR